MAISYETDIVACSNEQAALLRAGKLSAIDAQHIAEEIEDVGRSASWEATIREQRRAVSRRLRSAPSLRQHVGGRGVARRSVERCGAAGTQ